MRRYPRVERSGSTLVVSRVVIELEPRMHLSRVPELQLRESGERRAAMWLRNVKMVTPGV